MYRQHLAGQVIDLVKEIKISISRLGSKKLYFLPKEKLKTLEVGRDKLFRILKANQMLIIPKKISSDHKFAS